MNAHPGKSGVSPIDVSNPELSRTDTWQPLFAKLRAEDQA